MAEFEKISGTVEQIVFSNPDNGYTVCVLDCDGEPVTAVGVIPSLAEGETLSASGKWTVHENFGRQFKVESFEKTLPADSEGIYKFLASGYIKGLGPVNAMRIVEKYGEKSFEVLSEHPEWLSEFKGISKKRALDIGEDFRLKFGLRDVVMFCSEYFGAAFCGRIYKKYGETAVDLIRENPYILCDDIPNIGFVRVDRAAMKLGFPPDSRERLKSYAKHLLSQAAFSVGHCYVNVHRLAEQVAETLGVSEETAESCIAELTDGGALCRDGEKVSLKIYSEAEHCVAEKMLALSRAELPFRISGLEENIKLLEQKNGIEYAPEQKRAIRLAVNGGVTIITGGPGTGKTTVIKAILEIFSASGLSFMLCAPTGRAAKRMSEASGSEARTIHRLLETRFDGNEEPVFVHDENNPLPYNALVVDEVSMVDVLLMKSLLKALRDGCYLVLIGDSDQLPSVGAGNVLSDLIKSGRFPVVRLTEIFRQAKESLIVTNAHSINRGEEPVLTERKKDFFFLEEQDPEKIVRLISGLCEKRLPARYKLRARDDIQVITPTKKGPLGTAALNAFLQNTLNPPAVGKAECKIGGILYREGDKVMQTRNDYGVNWTQDGREGTGMFNGDIGLLLKLDLRRRTALLRFDDRLAEYDFAMFDNVEPAYAVTVHKSQGSEYPVVVMPFYDCAAALMSRSLLYTAVTRARMMFVGVGKPLCVAEMVRNNSRRRRNTSLGKLLEGGVGAEGKAET